MADAAKVRENRLRRAAARQGLVLVKSRTRDTRAVDFGTYQLRNEAGDLVAGGNVRGGFGLSLDQIEARLTGEADR